MVNILLFILVGLFAGTISGVIGIGGGVVIVPALVLLFGFTQQMAQGTTLALLVPPIGFLAAYTYFRAGYVDLKAAVFVCIGFFIGGLLGSKVAVNVPAAILKKVFGATMILIGIYMIFRK